MQVHTTRDEYSTGFLTTFRTALAVQHTHLFRENKILTAAWNADTCSLAIATAAGGVKIYDVLPRSAASFSSRSDGGRSRGAPRGAGKKQGQPQPSAATVISIAPPPPPPPATVVLRHEIVIRIVSSTQEGGRKSANRPVSSLATSCGSESWERGGGKRSVGNTTTATAGCTAAGAGILVGVAEGKHLCVWDLATGSTLLTALSMAPTGCTVEKVLWHGPTAVVAVLYHDGTGVTRVDVHQVDIAKEAIVPVRVGSVCLVLSLLFSWALWVGTIAVYLEIFASTSIPSASKGAALIVVLTPSLSYNVLLQERAFCRRGAQFLSDQCPSGVSSRRR